MIYPCVYFLYVAISDEYDWLYDDYPVYYIGSTFNIRKRLSNHLYQLRKNKHPTKFLQRDYNIAKKRCLLNPEPLIFWGNIWIMTPELLNKFNLTPTFNFQDAYKYRINWSKTMEDYILRQVERHIIVNNYEIIYNFRVCQEIEIAMPSYPLLLKDLIEAGLADKPYRIEI